MQQSAQTQRDNLIGCLFMLLAMASFALGDTVLKVSSTTLPLAQILVIRGLFALILFGVICFFLGQFKQIDLLLHPAMAVRVLGELIATYFFLTALFNMPIANASAILQVLPLTVTLGAALFFGEAIGWRRMLAIVIGFIGVLLIVQPGLEGFNKFSIYCIIAVLGTTVRDLATRRLPAKLPTMLVSFITVISVIFGGIFLSLFQEWQATNTKDIAALALASIFMMSGYFAIVSAMRVGEVALVTPVRYSVILFTLILGMIVFDEFPDLLTILGSMIVVATGLYTLYREHKLAKAKRREMQKLKTSQDQTSKPMGGASQS